MQNLNWRFHVQTVKVDSRKFLYLSFVFLLISIIIYFFSVLPVIDKKLEEAKVIASTLVEDANFTYVQIEDGSFSSDIRPQIFVYVLNETDSIFEAVVVDKDNKLNPYYWDRGKGEDSEIRGLVLKNNSFEVISNDSKFNFSYPIFVQEGKILKDQVISFVDNFELSFIIKALLLISLILLVSILISLFVLKLFLIEKIFKSIFIKKNFNYFIISFSIILSLGFVSFTLLIMF